MSFCFARIYDKKPSPLREFLAYDANTKSVDSGKCPFESTFNNVEPNQAIKKNTQKKNKLTSAVIGDVKW